MAALSVEIEPRAQDGPVASENLTERIRKAFERKLFVNLSTGNQASALGALFTQNTRQATGINIRNGYHTLIAEVVLETSLATEITGMQRQVANNQTRTLDFFGFFVLCVNPDITDMGTGQSYQLARVGGICEDLLITGHGGIEHHLADRLPVRTNGLAVEYTAVFEN